MRPIYLAFCGLMLAIVGFVPSPSLGQILPVFGKAKGLPQISVVKDGLPALANPMYGEVMLSGNEALLEPAWLIGSLRDGSTGQVLKWNNYLLPDAKPNVKLLSDTVFEGFVDASAAARTEWLSTVKLQNTDRAVAEVSVTRVSVTSVGPKQIDRAKLLKEIVERLPADQQSRYSVVIAYIDIAITSTRFQHYEVDGDVSGYGGRIGSEWYYKDKQKSVEHRLVAISAPLQFAVTTFGPQAVETGHCPEGQPCYQLVGDAIKRGELQPDAARPCCVRVCPSCNDFARIVATQEEERRQAEIAAERLRAEKDRFAAEQLREASRKNAAAYSNPYPAAADPPARPSVMGDYGPHWSIPIPSQNSASGSSNLPPLSPPAH